MEELTIYVLASTAALIVGYLTDLILGDPPGWPHIVRGIGALISAFEKIFYPIKSKRLGGGLLAVCVSVLSFGIPAGLLFLCMQVSPWLYVAAESLLCWQLLAVKSLKSESLRVYVQLAKGDLPGARQALSMIVGRDTQELDQEGVVRATVETVAENTADGVTAPLFYIMLGGGALGCLYKAVNTMDSMIGYKNQRYMDFGRFAAKLDDVLNYIPSRLCALLMLFSTKLCGMDSKSAFSVWKRDRRKHESPNSAQTEAVMAGALGARLGGPSYYHAKLCQKPYIGDGIRQLGLPDITAANKLMYTTSGLTLALALLERGLFYAAL